MMFVLFSCVVFGVGVVASHLAGSAFFECFNMSYEPNYLFIRTISNYFSNAASKETGILPKWMSISTMSLSNSDFLLITWIKDHCFSIVNPIDDKD